MTTSICSKFSLSAENLQCFYRNPLRLSVASHASVAPLVPAVSKVSAVERVSWRYRGSVIQQGVPCKQTSRAPLVSITSPRIPLEQPPPRNQNQFSATNKQRKAIVLAERRLASIVCGSTSSSSSSSSQWWRRWQVVMTTSALQRVRDDELMGEVADREMDGLMVNYEGWCREKCKQKDRQTSSTTIAIAALRGYRNIVVNYDDNDVIGD